ncbi:uncharacterized protein BDZ99DRAFT_539651 [Mytilinidion resinicola]|uniref:NACHT-NTPase and P-loop NTPases N-terminal domain-containing protein n=1 Tax=Mytilinidion resinicola TaxID=574789 RepID=A0A6A6YDG4_9PEZI|nr:uncharacterized protein BDZ99DRAFT_539651 [Mytilinidion resinicola]KAF2806135.1 hypothetical protein BDZ99DRAFT_539651 [Mytilinidion resinicola]
MAESLALVGFASAIVQFVDFSTKVIARLDDYHTAIGKVPKAFLGIKTELPLVLKTVGRTREQSQSGLVSSETQQALIPVVDGCCEQVKLLDAILVELLPKPWDSSWKVRMKALSSVRKEKETRNITATLDSYVQKLTYYEVVNQGHASNATSPRPSVPDSKTNAPKPTYYILPQLAVSQSIQRDDLMKRMQDALVQPQGPSPPVIVLLGIGGQGKSQLAMEYCKKAR